MYQAVTVERMRAAEAAAIAVVGDDLLMQRAAAGLAAVVVRELKRRRGKAAGAKVLILTGTGNNGGDGLFAGLRLARRGVQVVACRASDRVHERGWAALLAAGGRELSVDEARAGLASFDLVIDAILGIGGRPGLRSPWDGLAADLAASGAPVVACDLPSGISADPPFGVIGDVWLASPRGCGVRAASHVGPSGMDGHVGRRGALSGGLPSGVVDRNQPIIPADDLTGTGQTAGVIGGRQGTDLEASFIRADVTVTFGERKLCHVLEPARSACGWVELIDIGLGDVAPDVVAWQPDDAIAHWPVPGPAAHKYTRGVVGLDTGSARYPGAGVLSAIGAARAGAGMVRYLGPDEVGRRVLDVLPNVVLGDGRVNARVLGCGWGDRTYGDGVVAAAVDSGLPLVIDADGLRHLPARLHPGVVLTPHAGELARLLGCERSEVEADPLASVRETVRRYDVTVLLKGATQVVGTPGDPVLKIAVPGPAWTAQAGSGDVLAGMCGALLAAGLPPAEAALAAASAQAMAAAAHPGPVPPQELAAFVGTLRNRRASAGLSG